MKLIQKYTTGEPAAFSESTLQSINKVVRSVLIPRMKFIETSKRFGTFEQPDFSDDTCWVHRVFDKLGALKNATETRKAEIWMAYRTKISKQFGVHRANITAYLKTTFIKGKSIDRMCSSVTLFTNTTIYNVFSISFYIHLHKN